MGPGGPAPRTPGFWNFFAKSPPPGPQRRQPPAGPRMPPAFEHLRRNCATHGIEAPQLRVAAGKPATGTITVDLRHEGNDVSVEFRDDGAGLNLPRILEKATEQGILAPDALLDDAEIASLIF